MSSVQQPWPYVFLGGQVGDYRVELGQAGSYLTRHVPSRRTIQSVVPPLTQAPTGLARFAPLLGMAGGLLSLGVGIFGAYQEVKTREAVQRLGDALDVHFSEQHERLGRLQSLAVGQLHTLMALRSELAHMDAAAEARQAELLEAIGLVVGEVRDLRQHELLARQHELLDARRHMFEVGGEAEARAVIEAARKVRSWLAPLLGDLPQGSPFRLPFIVGQADAMSAMVDGLDVLALVGKDERQLEYANRVRMEMHEAVAAELRTTLDSSTSWTLATDPTHRHLQYGLILDGARAEVPASLLCNDGLAPLRDALAMEGSGESLEDLVVEDVRDILHHEAWTASAQDGPLLPLVSVRQIADAIGAPAEEVAAGRARHLLASAREVTAHLSAWRAEVLGEQADDSDSQAVAAIFVDPDWPGIADRSLASARQVLDGGDSQSAAEILGELLRRVRRVSDQRFDDAGIWSSVEDSCERLGEGDDALRLLADAAAYFARRPTPEVMNPAVRVLAESSENIACAAARDGDWSRVVATCDLYLAAVPSGRTEGLWTDVHHYRADALRQLERWPEARDSYTAALANETDPGLRLEIKYWRALCDFHLGHERNAMREMRKLMKDSRRAELVSVESLARMENSLAGVVQG